MRLQQVVRPETALIVPLIAAVAAAAARPYAQFTSGVNLVEVYASVSDRHGEPVTGLTAADFRVAEDGAQQTITTFAAGEFPLAVGIGLDRSFSMGGKSDRLSVAKSAVRAFIRALRSEDEVMVMAIGSETSAVAPLSADHGRALDAVERIDAWGTTPLYDATLDAIEAIQPAHGRRALLLLSDGVDRSSEISPGELLDRARQRDVLVYPIAISGSRPPVFAELATATGGRSFLAKEPRELASILTGIARELRFQYLLGYVPPPRLGSAQGQRSGESSWHSIEVSVDRPDARVRAREGYFAR
jgi:Ca-activated chloride channel homolog